MKINDDNVTFDDYIDDNLYLCFSDERLLPNDADVDADWPGGHGGAQVPGPQGQPPPRGQLAQERRAGQPHGLQAHSHHRHRQAQTQRPKARGLQQVGVLPSIAGGEVRGGGGMIFTVLEA
jgi:hypothetical protein